MSGKSARAQSSRPASVNRFVRAYVSNRVTGARLVSEHPLGESVRIRRRMADGDRGSASSHMICLSPLFSCAAIGSSGAPTQQLGS
jgi:hypothetical protein